MQYANITIPQLASTVQVLLKAAEDGLKGATTDFTYGLHRGYIGAYEVILRNLIKEQASNDNKVQESQCGVCGDYHPDRVPHSCQTGDGE